MNNPAVGSSVFPVVAESDRDPTFIEEPVIAPDTVAAPVMFVSAFNSIVPVPLGSSVIAALLGELRVDPTAVKSPKLSPLVEALIVTTPAESVDVVTFVPP